MSRKICPHLDILQLSLSDLYTVKQGLPCSQCAVSRKNLWICLYKTCLNIGCSEEDQDHGTKHYRANQLHCLQLNLSTRRIWCYICRMEVFVPNQIQSYKRRASVGSNDSSSEKVSPNGFDRSDDSSDEDDDDRPNFESGLIGLQNIANTCYMNAALQALSNTPPLTKYFLECGDIVEAHTEQYSAQHQSHNGGQRKSGLARSYHRLVKDMWCRSKRSNGYIVPSGILNGIRNVHPMFRGYQQHDTQEFLRCFMDQLHEELKEQTPPPPESILKSIMEQMDDDRSQCSSPSQSMSEAEYETCDSGVSEQSSLSDETPTNSTASVLAASSQSPKRLSTTNPANRYSRASSPSSSGCSTSTAAHTTPYQRNKPFATHRTAPNHSSVYAKSTTPTPEPAPRPATHRSIISDVFDGKLLSSVQCLTCDRISTREETFQDLSLPIPGKDHMSVIHNSSGTSPNHSMTPPMPLPPNMQMNASGGMCSDAMYQVTQEGWFWWVWNWFRSFFWGPAVSLHDCMAAFFSADELKGDNMYSCEKCKKLRNGMKYSRVLELPEMLCVHLKRFRHDLSYSSKIASPVHFPLRGLDMSAYLHRDCVSDVSTYDLTAVICHHGTVGGGHYTSFARHDSNDKWYEYDDQLVTLVSEEMVQSCEAYVLFYRKSNPQMVEYRAQAMQLLDACAEQPPSSDIRFFVSKQWLNRFNTFAEPGPIDNWALLCPHGALPPSKLAIQSQLIVPLTQPLWEFFYRKFGGGPVVNHLYECDICRRAAEALERRQHDELNMFQKLKDETTLTLYAISMAWLRQWQIFVNGGDAKEDPGPINNANIAGQQPDDMEIFIRSVRAGSDYAQINSLLWRFFYSVYGGGPIIVLRGNPDEPAETAVFIANDQSSDDIPQLIDNTETTITIKSVEPILPLETAIVPSKPVKVAKNVSFEDDGTSSPVECADTNSIASADTLISNGSTHSQPSSLQSSKSTTITPAATSTISKVSDIVGKKDKRHHRGAITASGLFGAEGKYSSHANPIGQSNPTQNIPAHQTSSSAIHINGIHSVANTVESSPPVNNTVITTNPLSNGCYDHQTDMAAPEAPLIPANSRKAHKMRKKLKSKASRKHQQHHHQTLSENGAAVNNRRGGSDCD